VLTKRLLQRWRGKRRFLSPIITAKSAIPYGIPYRKNKRKEKGIRIKENREQRKILPRGGV